MRVVRKKGSILVLGLLLSILVGMQGAYAAIQMPEKVRIGLFYENTAVSVLSVSAVKGMQLGFVKDNNFSLIAEENSTNSIVIRKDAYYTKNGTTYT
ncbi:MAG: hypothetical protein N2484_05145, partial [Clostridia bacterium]|nr:hypothetical protein [Clostridia bacterium]